MLLLRNIVGDEVARSPVKLVNVVSDLCDSCDCCVLAKKENNNVM